MEGFSFSKEEISVFKTVFDSCDGDRQGRIHINQLSGMLAKLGKNEDEVIQMTEDASRVADENEGCLTFHDILMIIQRFEKANDKPFEGSDPKVLEFLRILEEYRVKCEDEGNYLEAGRAFRQLGVLRKQEEKRQQKAIQARQISEKQDVQLAHNMQFNEFNKSWDKYMEEYDSMAQMYIQQMTERHAVVLLEYQKQLRQDLANKPPKWSRALLDQRRKQHINARNKNYTLAQKLKKQSDKNEERERREMEQDQAILFAKREAKFRNQQQTELQALLKRIECRRKEHLKQRGLDTKRLLQRNRNVQAVLDTKQAAECQKLFSDIKKLLYSSAVLTNGAAPPKPHGATLTGGGLNISKKSAKGGASKRGDSEPLLSQTTGGHYPQTGGEDDEYQQDVNHLMNQYGHQSGYGASPSAKGDAAYAPQFLSDMAGPNFNNLVYDGSERPFEEGSLYEEDDN